MDARDSIEHQVTYDSATHRQVRTPYVDGQTVASIQTIFARSRLSHQSWQARQLDGRLDGRQAWRNDARGHVDIFRDRKAPSPTKLNVWLLVDASGSMNGDNSEYAQDVAATLVEAFKRSPNVKLHIWQHNAMHSGGTSVYRNYEPGKNNIRFMPDNINGGNADGFALDFIGTRAIRTARPDERTLIIVVSDGQPSVHGNGATNYDIAGHTVEVAARLRSRGATVLSVAITAEAGQNKDMYGADNVVPFNQEAPSRWADFSRELAGLFGRKLR